MSETPKRPGTVIFVALVLFVFGGLLVVSAASTAFYAIMIAANPREFDPNAKARFDDIEASLRFVAHEIPGNIITIAGLAVLDIVFGLALIGCGVGVLRLAPAARKATIYLVLVDFLYTVAKDIFALLVIVPAQIRFYELHPPDMPQGGADAMNLFMVLLRVGAFAAVLLGFVMQIIVVVLVLWILNSAKTKAAFAGTPVPDAAAEEPTREQQPKSASPYSGYDDE